MPAEYQRNGGHYQQCQHLQADAIRANKYNQQQEGNDQSRQVHFVTVWQHQRFRRNGHSLPNATTEPVNVTAPMKIPRNTSVR